MESDFKNKIQKEIENFYKNLDSFYNTLKNFFYIKYKRYLITPKAIKLEKNNSNLCKMGENEQIQLYNATLNLKNKIKKIPIKYLELKELLARLIYCSDLLIECRNEQLIGVNFPKNSQTSKKQFYISIKINTEESYAECTDFRNIQRLRSTFLGESAEFIIRIMTNKDASTYYEINPPKNTIISKAFRGTTAPCCNIMMEDFHYNNNDHQIRFRDKFNERLVLHIPREKARRSNEHLPRIFLTFRPFKSLQGWILVSFILGIIYNIFLLILFLLLVFNSSNSNFLNFLSTFIEIAKSQSFWIFGLTLGNRLWLQTPKFLWKKSTITSIIIILSGFILLTLCVFFNDLFKYLLEIN